MAISLSDNDPRVRYTATSGQTVFAVPFEFFDNDDFDVFEEDTSGSVTQKTLTTHYTVTGGSGSTGSITFGTGITLNHIITIVRNIDIERVTDFTGGAAINRAALNEQLDKLTAITSDIKDVNTRTVRLADWDADATLTLPSVANRADKLLGFDSSGNISTASADLTVDSLTIAYSGTPGDGTFLRVNTDEDSRIVSENGSLILQSNKGSGVGKVLLDGNASPYVVDIIGTGGSTRISSGDVLIDAASDITLDADGGEIYFKDGGTSKFTFRISAAGNRILADSATTIETSAGSINMKAHQGYVDFLTNGGAQSIQLQSTTTPEIRFYQDSNTLDVDVATLSGTRTLTLPDATDTLVGKATTDTLTNKTLTSAVLNGNVSGSAILDEDNMASNSSSRLATQQSIKAYVDAQVATVPTGDITGVIAGTGLTGGGTSGTVTLNINATTGLTATSSTLSIDSSVVTLTGSQTLSNKTLTSPTLNGSIGGSSIKDEDDLVSNSASHLATQQSIKAYVDTQVAGGGAGNLSTVLGIGNTTGGNNIRITGGDSIIGLSGDLTIDVAANLAIDVDGGTVEFKDGGVHFGNIKNDTSNFIIESEVSDKDIVFRGSDGGSTVSALTLDMSDAGTATFNHDIKLPDSGKAIFGAGSDLQIYHDGNHSYISDQGTGHLKVFAESFFLNNASDTEQMIGATVNGAVDLFYNGSKKLETASTGVNVTGDLLVGGTTFDNGGFSSSANGINVFDATAPIMNLVETTGNTSFYMAKGPTYGYIGTADAHFIGFSTSDTERMRIDSDGRVGIGTTPNTSIDTSVFPAVLALGDQGILLGNSTSSQIGVNFYWDGSAFKYLGSGKASRMYQQAGDIVFQTTDTSGSANGALSLTERMRISSSGNVGIGLSNPSDYYAKDLVISAANEGGITLVSGTTHNAYLAFADGTSGDARYRGQIFYLHNTDKMGFATAGSTRMQIDSSGRVMIGTSTEGNPAAENLTISDSGHAGITIRSTDSTSSRIYFSDATSGTGEYTGYLIYDHTNNHMSIATGATERIRIGDSGNVGIGTSSPSSYYSDRLVVGVGDEDGITIAGSSTHQHYIMFADGTSGDARYRGYISYDHADDHMKLASSGSERMRIDSSGNLLVGKNSTSITSAGTIIQSNGTTWKIRDGSAPLFLNRLSSDGEILNLYKDSSLVGTIGVLSSNNVYFGSSASGHAGLVMDGSSIVPLSALSRTDNSIDLGEPSFRFDDIYATNGTIQTSDRNEKQDIEELTDAEQRVAVAAKGLLRKFRWKDKVAEKGDEARTHFGIIAQDLQAAFAAEGLDAGKYAMFTSTTWTDEDTGEERTRMGVRYSELLAFIIAGI